MTTKRVWPVRAAYMLVAVALVMSLILTAAPASTVVAQNDVKAEWNRVGTPSQAGWVLAPESVIHDYAVAAEGEVAYAIVETEARPGDPTDWAPWFLLRSTTHAATWTDITGRLATLIHDDDTIWKIWKVATDDVDPDFVAVAVDVLSASSAREGIHVFVSNDGAASFTFTRVDEDFDNDIVFDLAVSPAVGNVRNLAIAGWDNDDGEAAVFRSRVTNGEAASWTNVTTGPSATTGWQASEIVTGIKFSPSWSADRTVLVTTVDEWGPSPTNTNVRLQAGTWNAATTFWNERSDLGIEAVRVMEDVDLPTWLADFDARAIAGMAIPSDYDSRNPGTRILWVWVNYLHETAGDARNEIFRVANVDAGTAGPMSPIEGGRVWLTNITYQGNIARGKALAGLLGTGKDGIPEILTAPCAGVAVYRNFDIANMIICCDPWSRACKLPTGQAAMAVRWVGETKAYAVALHGLLPYDEGAWSFSFDDGFNWNQLSLIDTHIDYLSDVAVSPDCNKTMLFSVNLKGVPWFFEHEEGDTLCDSVWLHAEELPEASEYSGRWIRTLARQLRGDNSDDFPFVPERGLIRLNPEETEGHTVYVFDRMTGRVWRDDLEGLGCWQPTTSVLDIVDLAVRDADTIFALGDDGRVAMFNGDSWHTAVDSEVEAGWTIAVWGDDILVGGQNGRVAHSDDGGETFTLLPAIPLPTGVTGITHRLVTVAFDSYFGENDVIYAGVVELPHMTGDIYMWIIDESTSWVNLLARPSTFQLTGAGSTTDTHRVAYTGIVLDDADGNPMTGPATGGVLYASYITNNTTGVARALTPLMEVDECQACPVDWDFLRVGLTTAESFRMAPHALKICGCLTPDTFTKIFAIGAEFEEGDPPMFFYDMARGEHGTVWMFEDCYSKVGVDLRQPATDFVIGADPCDCKNQPFTATWDPLCDACVYEIQFASDPDFAFIVFVDNDVETPAADPHANIGQVLLPGQTYYWRVRAVEAGTTQRIRSWWSEARSLTVGPFAGTGASIVAPPIGATDVRITDIPFSWSIGVDADTFNWQLARDGGFTNIVASAPGLTTTSYLYTGELSYDTSYFWRVTAIKDGAPISQAIGSFTTRPEVVPPPVVEPDPTPFWVWVVIAIGAVLVIVVIVLIFRTRRT